MKKYVRKYRAYRPIISYQKNSLPLDHSRNKSTPLTNENEGIPYSLELQQNRGERYQPNKPKQPRIPTSCPSEKPRFPNSFLSPLPRSHTQLDSVRIHGAFLKEGNIWHALSKREEKKEKKRRRGRKGKMDKFEGRTRWFYAALDPRRIPWYRVPRLIRQDSPLPSSSFARNSSPPWDVSTQSFRRVDPRQLLSPRFNFSWNADTRWSRDEKEKSLGEGVSQLSSVYPAKQIPVEAGWVWERRWLLGYCAERGKT